MACARCDFYIPKASTKGQLFEAKGNHAGRTLRLRLLSSILQQAELRVDEFRQAL